MKDSETRRGNLVFIIAGAIVMTTATSFAYWTYTEQNSSAPFAITNPANNNSKSSSPQDQTSSLPNIRDGSLRVEDVADGLSFPTSMAFLDRNTILVLQKNDGKVMMISNNTLQKQPVLQINVESYNERGLLGIAVSKDTKGGAEKVFLYYTGKNNQGEIRNMVYSYEWTGKDLTDKKLILDLPGTPGPNHDGGKMVMGKDGSLYAVIGNLNRKGMLQNINSGDPPDDTGVILRINPEDGSPAKGNPFTPDTDSNTAERLGKYFAYGIRNSFGLGIDPVTGSLWDTENGPDGYDEINLVEPGFNSGWQQVMGPESRESGSDHNLVNFPNSRYADPVFSWKNSVAPTAIEFLNSTKLGEKYANSIFVGDYLNGNLYNFQVDDNRTGLKVDRGGGLSDNVADNNAELSTITFGTDFAGGITDVKTGPDGYLYILTFGGNLFRIVPQ